jgi:NAD(P)-dependent dehydrogenase (short-subunit alcohol dehydrogenase family)
MSRILVTGATDGLGLALSRELVRAGHEVVLHGRNAVRAEAALRQTGAREWAFADFASLKSVHAMAAKLDPVDVLVNNAGIGTTLPGGEARLESKDGYELRFQVNYLAGYLLTKVLAPPHVVNVASAGQAPIDFDDVMLTRGYSGMRAYAQSKLAQIMHAFDLAQSGVIANALHPATYMPTKMVIAARGYAVSTLEEGVEATFALVSRTDVSGRYFNGLNESRADPQAYDEQARRRLRTLSDELLGRDLAPPT